MSNRIIFGISISPRETLTTENSTEKEVISSEVNKILGGSGTITGLSAYDEAGSSQGFADGAAYYLEAPYGSDLALPANAAAKGIFIKNTGKAFSSNSVLGDTLDYSIRVTVGTTKVAVLKTNECFFVKDNNGGLSAANFKVKTVLNSDDTADDTLAVEFLIVD